MTTQNSGKNSPRPFTWLRCTPPHASTPSRCLVGVPCRKQKGKHRHVGGVLPKKQKQKQKQKIKGTNSQVCRMAEVCRKGTLGSMLARRAASLLLIRLLFVIKPPLWERERGQTAEWAYGGMTQEIHVFPTHGTFPSYLTTRIFYNATRSRNPT